jgi:hypothetical protein
MQRKTKRSPTRQPWVDVFSGSTFTGEMRRITLKSSEKVLVIGRKEAAKIRSVVVGPDATARFDRRPSRRPVVLVPRTIVRDISHLARDGQELKFVVEPARLK